MKIAERSGKVFAAEQPEKIPHSAGESFAPTTTFVIRKSHLVAAVALTLLLAVAGLCTAWLNAREREEQRHYEREETELIVANIAGARLHLFLAGKNFQDTTRVGNFASTAVSDDRMWLRPGNYFLQAELTGQALYWPIPLTGYRNGPEEDGVFAVTVRSLPRELPPRLFHDGPAFVYVPSGNFLLGDRLNPLERHYVRLGAFFMSPCEVSNAEFKEFLNDPAGYTDDSNWTAAGRKWKANHTCRTTALLKAGDDKFERFGQPDHPVVWVNWFEANAFCHWLTRKIGQGKWLFSLPTEAEWEKAGRGPDSFDYALGMKISDAEAGLYNWRKNPDAPITVVGTNETPSLYGPNRYGLYHMSGNVVEWTQSTNRHYNQQHRYVDDDRNHEDAPGLRVARGGSWYSASTALLYIPYRDAFQPEHSSHDIGFRIVARMLP